MNILVTGGAGYIGSHVVKQLLEKTDHKVVILDNLSTGSIKTIETLQKIAEEKDKKLDFIKGDLSDFLVLEKIFQKYSFDAVMHFAASIVVPESVKNPIKYYLNNTVNTINLINFCLKYNVNKFIFSSTAAVYGEPKKVPIKETDPAFPINPYGKSKLMVEMVLQDVALAHPQFKYIILRYFNVAGADLEGRIGPRFTGSTSLIRVAAETAAGKRDKMYIYGKNFPTPDGTCIRDFIHVEDLADAHIKSLDFLIEKNESGIFNCGYKKGYSVLEVINTMKRVSGVDFEVEILPPREGEVVISIADNQKIIKEMNWRPQYDDLEIICKSAFDWEIKLLNKEI